MNTNIIEIRQNVNIFIPLNNVPNYHLINFIPFQFVPDEMILKSIVYYSTANEAAVNISLVYCDFIKYSSDPICAFYNSVAYSPNTHFPITNPLSTNLIIRVLDVNGNYEVARTGNLSLLLEFVKYAKDMKQEKIY